MSRRAITLLLFALIACRLVNAADEHKQFELGIRGEGGKILTTAPSDTTHTPFGAPVAEENTSVVDRHRFWNPELTKAPSDTTHTQSVPTPPMGTFTSFSTYYESLEWMAADCDVIVRATVISTQVASTTIAQIRVEELLKGTLRGDELLTIELPESPSDTPQFNYVWKGDKVLFFLKKSQNDSFKYPIRPRWRQATINLSRAGYTLAVLMNCTSLRDPRQILTAAREAGRYSADPGKKPVMLGYITTSGGAAFVLPPDDRTEKLAHEWIAGKKIEYRVLGVRALHDFKSDRNIALARRLLFDAQSNSPRLGKWQIGYFPARVEAQNLLNDWSIPHEQVAEMGPVYVYRPIAFSWVMLIWPVMVIVLVLSLSVLRRHGYRILVSSAWILLCISAIGCICWAWVRSKNIVDELMFATANAHHEIASTRGAIQYQLMREWTIPSRLVFGSFDLRQYDDQWSMAALAPLVNKEIAGFMSGHGHLAGPVGAIHPYSLVRLPYWILIAPFAVGLVYQSYLLSRQWRRRRRGLCRNCGYDLRGSANGRCPECGIRLPAAAAAAVGIDLSKSAPVRL